ncbi:MAG: TonB-dependent receptor [Bacteroidales bacterium]|nr:TonB-dependent receptor [Bacteroidales bacterium]
MNYVSKKVPRVLAAAMLLCFSIAAFAQQIVVSGHVKDAYGEPIIGANAMLVGTTTGTTTDIDGNFSLKAEQGATIKVSYIGYKPQEVAAAPSLVITLEEDAHVLEEAVVIGYGVVKKADATGSVTAIEPDAMNKGLVTNAQDMITGKIAGVNVVSDGGTPGAGATITIRGGSSLSASNSPLVVIDGLALDNNGIQGVANPLSTINPNDIESFTVLKDASATAIYGSRAANGVIIITTKKGDKGSKPRLSYNGNVSVSTPVRLREVMTGDQFRALAQDIYGERENASDILGLLGTANTDWQSLIYRNALSHDQNLTLAGGLSWMPYRVSVGYTNQNGIVKTSNFERFTASVNLAPTFFEDYLKFNINAKGMLVNNRYADGGAIGGAAAFDPTQPVNSDIAANGGYWQWMNGNVWNTQAPINPVSLLEQKRDEATSWDFIGNIEADYKLHFFPDMRVHANIGIDVAGGTQNTYLPREAASTLNKGSNGYTTKYKSNKMLNAYLQYAKEFGANNIDVMAGYEWQHFYNEGESAYNNLDGDNPTGDLWKKENYLVSFFGRLNYQLFSRYLLTATVRYDGTSRFSGDNRWGLFPSVALAWKIKEESFLQDVNWLSDLKLRLGWGITGQQEIGGYYDYIPVYSQSKDHAFYPIGIDENGNYIYYPYARPDAYNPDLKWEETTTYNAGLDFGFLNGRIRGAIDYYLRDTKDLLNMTSVSAGTNFGPAVMSNVGSLRNQGVEFSIEATPVQTKDWTWEVGYNVTYNQNEITKLSNGVSDDYYVEAGYASAGTGSPIKIHKVGYPAGSFYVYEQVYDPETGKPIQGCFVDRNADGQITGADKYVYENPAADVTMGFTSKLMWKNWDFSFSLRAALGNYVYNNNDACNSNLDIYSTLGFFSNRPLSALDTQFFGTDDSYASDYYVQNASFLRCDNITLGYSFKGSVFSGRVYATVQNPFVITGYNGIDPEVNGGIDNNMYPRPLVSLIGLTLDF